MLLHLAYKETLSTLNFHFKLINTGLVHELTHKHIYKTE